MDRGPYLDLFLEEGLRLIFHVSRKTVPLIALLEYAYILSQIKIGFEVVSKVGFCCISAYAPV